MIMIMISLLGLGFTGVAIVYVLMNRIYLFIVLFMLESSAAAEYCPRITLVFLSDKNANPSTRFNQSHSHYVFWKQWLL